MTNQKKETLRASAKQIYISKENHDYIKIVAIKNGVGLTAALNHIIEHYKDKHPLTIKANVKK